MSAFVRMLCVCADARVHLCGVGEGREGREGEGLYLRRCGDLSQGNFITATIVRPSHGQPCSHRLIVRSFVCPFVVNRLQDSLGLRANQNVVASDMN